MFKRLKAHLPGVLPGAAALVLLPEQMPVLQQRGNRDDCAAPRHAAWFQEAFRLRTAEIQFLFANIHGYTASFKIIEAVLYSCYRYYQILHIGPPMFIYYSMLCFAFALVSRRRAGPAGIEFNHAMASRQKLTYCTGIEHRWAQCRQKLSSQLLAIGRKKGLIPSIFPWPRESIHLAHLGTSS